MLLKCSSVKNAVCMSVPRLRREGKQYRLTLSVPGQSALIIRHPALDVSENGHLSQTHTVGNLCCSAATSRLVQMPASVTAAPAQHSWRWGLFFIYFLRKGLSQWANTPSTFTSWGTFCLSRFIILNFGLWPRVSFITNKNMINSFFCLIRLISQSGHNGFVQWVTSHRKRSTQMQKPTQSWLQSGAIYSTRKTQGFYRM